MIHTPVLKKEVIDYLNPKPNENFIDGTVGEGSYAKVILEKTAPSGKILGIDWDQRQIESSRENLKEYGNRIVLVWDNYANLKNIISQHKFDQVDGIILDLGISSRQYQDSGKGFSFQKEEPLDMRYSDEILITAGQIVNNYSRDKLEDILREYGEEKFAGKIAREIVSSRSKKPIKNTLELVEIIKKAVPDWYSRQKINSATRTFQALRIVVNGEIDNLKKVLPVAADILNKGGRLAIISFHSLEDRIVKNFFKEAAREGKLKIITKKPAIADKEELKENPRSRSAKLRIAIKI